MNQKMNIEKQIAAFGDANDDVKIHCISKMRGDTLDEYPR